MTMKNRPIRRRDNMEDFLSGQDNVASANDYTGLIPSAVEDAADAESYCDMKCIPMPKKEYYQDKEE